MREALARGAAALRIVLALAAPLAAGQETESVRVEQRAPPPRVPPSMRESLEGRSVRVAREGRAVASLWFAGRVPSPVEPSEPQSPLATRGLSYRIASGALVGVIELEEPWTDYRGQRIAPGVYALRYAAQPIMKEHRGVSEFRDTLLLVPPQAPAEDLAALVRASRQVSRTGHPAVMALFPVEPGAPLPRLDRTARGVRVLAVAAGGRTLGLALAGEGMPGDHRVLRAPGSGSGIEPAPQSRCDQLPRAPG